MSYACLDCRKSFKRSLEKPVRDPEVMVCPNCGSDAFNFGRHFKSPKISDKKQWDKIRFLFDHGFRFQKIRPTKNSVVSVSYPKSLAEAKEFVVTY